MRKLTRYLYHEPFNSGSVGFPLPVLQLIAPVNPMECADERLRWPAQLVTDPKRLGAGEVLTHKGDNLLGSARGPREEWRFLCHHQQWDPTERGKSLCSQQDERT